MIAKLRALFLNDIRHLISSSNDPLIIPRIASITNISERSIKRYIKNESAPNLISITKYYSNYKLLHSWSGNSKSIEISKNNPSLIEQDDIKIVSYLLKSKRNTADVQKHFGLIGIYKLRDYMEKDLINVDGKEEIHPTKNLINSLSLYYTQKNNKFNSSISSAGYVFYLNERGQARLSELLSRFNQEIKIILNNSNYTGEHPHLLTQINFQISD